MINSYEIKKNLYLNCLYSKTYVFKNKNLNNSKGKEQVSNMIKVASLTRKGFMAGDISTVMSPRTVLHWAENFEILKILVMLLE